MTQNEHEWFTVGKLSKISATEDGHIIVRKINF
jgi:hypothetical protein